jgi:hypothetical protein
MKAQWHDHDQQKKNSRPIPGADECDKDDAQRQNDFGQRVQAVQRAVALHIIRKTFMHNDG